MKPEVIVALVILALAFGFLFWVNPGSGWLYQAIFGQ